jgi:DNA-binding transcriptional regulator YdaS (Cro superfamily)
MDTNRRHTALAQAIRKVGGQQELARRIKVSQPTVSDWLNGKAQITADKVPDIEALTGIRAERLHPAFARLSRLRAAANRAA